MHSIVSGLLSGVISGGLILGLGQISQKKGGTEPSKPSRVVYEYSGTSFQTEMDEYPNGRAVSLAIDRFSRDGWEPYFWYESEVKVNVKLGRDIHRKELNVLVRRPKFVLGD